MCARYWNQNADSLEIAANQKNSLFDSHVNRERWLPKQEQVEEEGKLTGVASGDKGGGWFGLVAGGWCGAGS